MNSGDKNPENLKLKIKLFGERTSFHAIPNVCHSERLITKLFWIFCFMIFASLSVWFVQKSVSEYLNFGVHTDIEIIQEEKVEFPTITFCNLEVCGFNDYDYSTYLKKFKQDEEDRFKESRDQEIEKNLKILNTKTNFFSAKEVFLRKYDKDDLTNVLNKENEIINETMLNCKFNNKNCYFSEFEYFNMSEFNKCFKFNSGNNLKRQKLPIKSLSRFGKKYGLKLEIYLGTERKCRSPLATTSGLIVYIHDKFYTLTDEDTGILVQPNNEIDIGIDLTSVKKLPAPYSECFLNLETTKVEDTTLIKETIKITNTYTQQYCLQLCFQKFLIKNCNCYDHTLPGFIPEKTIVCSKFIDSLYNCQYLIKKLFYNGINDIPCLAKCPKECDYVKYDMTVSSSNYSSRIYNGIIEEINKKIENDSEDLIEAGNIVSVNIYFKSNSVKKITEKPAILAQDLLANVGGAMGLFLGISFLSFVEIVEIITEIVYYYMHKSTSDKISKQK